METLWVLVLLVCACVSLSGACSCFPDMGPDRYCRYDLIFRGTILAEYEERQEPMDHSDPMWEFGAVRDWVYTVRVEQAIKMPEALSEAKIVTVRTSMRDNLCGVRFPVDVEAILFGFLTDKGEIQTGLCDPNAPWDSLSEWDQELITDHIVDYCNSREAAQTTSTPSSPSPPPSQEESDEQE